MRIATTTAKVTKVVRHYDDSVSDDDDDDRGGSSVSHAGRQANGKLMMQTGRANIFPF